MRRLIFPVAIVVTIIFAGLFLLSSAASVKNTNKCNPAVNGSCCKARPKSNPADREIMLENLSRQFIIVAPILD